MTDASSLPASEEVAELRRHLGHAVVPTCSRWLASESHDLVHDALLRVPEIRRRRKSRSTTSW